MRKILLLFIISVCFTLSACKKNDHKIAAENTFLEKFTGLVNKAIEHDANANAQLSNLVDLNQQKVTYIKKIIDTIRLNYRKYYYVLLEYNEPEYNRFAVYDEKLNMFMLDKSLNGEITIMPFFKDDAKFIGIEENYMSKSVYVLSRFSLYGDEPGSVRLVFRSFLSMFTPKYSVMQDFGKITRDTIYMKIKPSRNFALKNYPTKDTVDIFVFDLAKYAFISQNNYVNNIVREEIASRVSTEEQINTVESRNKR